MTLPADIGFGYRPRAPWACDPARSRGRLVADNYVPFLSSDSRYGMRRNLVAVNASHPLLAGVTLFDGVHSVGFVVFLLICFARLIRRRRQLPDTRFVE